MSLENIKGNKVLQVCPEGLYENTAWEILGFSLGGNGPYSLPSSLTYSTQGRRKALKAELQSNYQGVHCWSWDI